VWQRLLRDALCPLVGLLIEIHEVTIAAEPRYLAVVVGLVLLGVPVDAALGVLAGRRNGSSGSPPPTPPRPPSSSPPPPGGSSPVVEDTADA
jgi:hypothetical protein